MGENSVAGILELAIEAARDHLAAVERRHTDRGVEEDVDKSFMRLRALSADYANALFDAYEEVTPWSDGDLDEGPEEVPPDSEGELPVPAAVSVLARYDYQIDDLDGLLDVARDRALSAGTGDEERLGNAGHAIYALFHAHGGVFGALLDVPQLAPITGSVEVVALDAIGSSEDGPSGLNVDSDSVDSPYESDVLFSFDELW